MEEKDNLCISLYICGQSPLGEKSYKSIQIQQIRALDLRDFEQICGMSSTSEALRGYFDERSEENSLAPWNL
jgi:hypothetical protein